MLVQNPNPDPSPFDVAELMAITFAVALGQLVYIGVLPRVIGSVLLSLWILTGLVAGYRRLYPRSTYEADLQRPPEEHGRQPWRWRHKLLPGRLPTIEAYWLITFLALGLWGLKAVLASLDTHGRLGPSDAPAIVSAAVGLPALIVAVIAAVPRIIRAMGAKARDMGARQASEQEGQAAVLRAQLEGQAAIIRAQAEMRRAEAEYLRVQRGWYELPPAPESPQGDVPSARPSANTDGDGQESHPAPP